MHGSQGVAVALAVLGGNIELLGSRPARKRCWVAEGPEVGLLQVVGVEARAGDGGLHPLDRDVVPAIVVKDRARQRYEE